MSSNQFMEFLEQIKKEAKPGELAMAVVRFAKDTTICHGFGAGISPIADAKEMIGTIKENSSEIEPKKTWNDFISVTASIFGKSYMEEDRGGEWVDSSKINFNFTLVEAPIAYSDGAKLNVVRVNNEKELRTDMFIKANEFSDRLFDKSDDILIGMFRREASYEEFRLMREKPEITVYLGSNAILEYLVSNKEPLALVPLFDALKIPLTDKLSAEVESEAMEKTEEFFKKYISFMRKDKEYEERKAILNKAAKSNGGHGYVYEKGERIKLDNKDDVQLQLYDDRESLKKAQTVLIAKAEELIKMNVARSVKEKIEIYPGVEINVKEQLKYIMQLAKEDKAKSAGKKVLAT